MQANYTSEQRAADAALSAKRGLVSFEDLRGVSRQMYINKSERQLANLLEGKWSGA